MNLTNSESWWQRGLNVLAGGPATLSKHPSRFPQGLAPVVLSYGNGPYVWDMDGNRYLDTIAALGPILLGYRHHAVDRAVAEQLLNGTSFSLLHPLEIEVAEEFCALTPGIEMCRWMRNGSDATNAAVRLARAVTGKRHIICSGYHGANYDWYAITTDKNAGVLQDIAGFSHQVPWGDSTALADACAKAGDDLAAIIVEVPPFPWNGLIKGTAEETALIKTYEMAARRNRSIFVLDEVITSLRYGLGGAQAYYGVSADLIGGGKALANGYPLAVLGGRRDLMRYFEGGNPFCSYTFGGETTSLAACKATLLVLQETTALDNLRMQGLTLGNGLQALFQKYDLPAEVWGNYARISIRWKAIEGIATDGELKTLWLAENVRRGILHGFGVIFPMICYQDVTVQEILNVSEIVCTIIRQAIDSGDFSMYIPCQIIDNVFSVRQ